MATPRRRRFNCSKSVPRATGSIATLSLQRLPLQPPRRRLSPSPQPSNPLPNPFHDHVSARRREETQSTSHCFVLQRQVAGERTRSAVDLPELAQAPRSDAAEACLTFASQATGFGALRSVRSSELRPSDIGCAPASPSSSLVEHVDVAFLLFSFTSLSASDIDIIVRVKRGERLALLLANHSL
jgi:hypothetical protein